MYDVRMTFTLRELSDRAEIHDLLVREAHALDKGEREAWERCFTPDAEIDYMAAFIEIARSG